MRLGPSDSARLVAVGAGRPDQPVEDVSERRLPGPGRDAVGLGQAPGREAGIGRTPGRRRVGRGRDALDRHGAPAAPGRAGQNRAGEIAPCGRTSVDAVEGAGGRRLILDQPQGDGGQRRREIGGRGRAAVLVVHHAQPVPLGREPQHRLDEVAPVRAHDPGGADDGMARVGAAHRHLAGRLAGAVDALRVHRRIGSVEALARTVEHVVGRDMDERDLPLVRLGGKESRCQGIQPPRGRDLALGPVHRGVGGRVDDRRITPFIERGGQSGLVGDVEVLAVGGMDPHAVRPGKSLKLRADLAGAAEDQDVHAHAPLHAPLPARPRRSPE